MIIIVSLHMYFAFCFLTVILIDYHNFIVVENSILVQSRFMLMESLLLFIIVIVLLSERKFSRKNKMCVIF